ncbi:NnrU family protein [Minwuia sp.]|uniref:NnrU family protein n=1 Tax=Minwuia sp. TaxID=2493630 RepID=UPI003A90890A
MTGEFSHLVIATLAFLLIHIVPASALRGPVVQAVGERAYLGLFSIVSLAALIWMIAAFNASPSGGFVWYHAGKIQYVSALIMFVALVLGIGGLIGANPASVGGKVKRGGDPATGFLRITRHPFLVSVVLWSSAHLLVRGEMRAIVFFGGLGLLAAVGTVLIDHKTSRRLGSEWNRFEAVTSIIPFLAILQGRNRLSIAELKWWRLAIGVAAFVLILMAHSTIMGVPPLP